MTTCRSKPAEKLPTKASELLRLAVHDAKAVSRRKGVVLDMEEWSRPFGDECHVCMAGAVMLKRLGFSPDRPSTPRESDDHKTTQALWAIDDMRTGMWPYDLAPNPTKEHRAQFRLVVDSTYDMNRDGGRAHWSTYLKAANLLESWGL